MERSTGQRFEDEVTEQPIDYSKKYSERKTVMENRSIENSPRTDQSCEKEFGERDSKVDLFGDYAETDLDQPTDYSLRYAEDEKQSPEYFPGSVQEDTVKTYCTEGTPYETPFNFSTATSMSDLRLEDAKEPVDSQKKLNKKVHGRKEDINYERTLSLHCNEDRSLLAEKELETSKASETSKPPCLSPEKLLNYYQPGTSDGFSHASSLGSAITQRNHITGIIAKIPCTDSSDKIDNVSEKADRTVANSNVNVSRIPDGSDSPTEGKSNSRVVDKEGKMVTFSRHDYYPEQTPLMFSPSSSLSSLSGFEQHSIHDDRSSIISDFSRRTSGAVSPSELPDSPTQTIPPSPRNHKNQCADFISKIPEEAVRPTVRHLSYSKCHPPRTSVFEDDIATFNEESTPIKFSTATSLSSLTIDDEVKIPTAPKPQNELKETSNDLDKNIKVNSVEEKTNNVEVEKDQEQVSDGDEDDEDMLAACISMGIQNNRYRQSFKTSTVQKSMQPESSNMMARCQRTPVLNRLEPSVPVTVISVDTPATTSKPTKPAIEVVAAPDTVHVYCTEGTPADISPVGSQSNLSALSMPSVQEDVERIEEIKISSEVECHRNDLSDESSNLSREDEKILDECIQSGIPKIRQITPPPATCMPFVPKTEILTQRFNICGTPSSSPVESGNKNPILRKPMSRVTLEHENDLSDDSPNHSDDEAILSECIKSGMPKVRALNVSSNTSLVSTKKQPEQYSKIRNAASGSSSSYMNKPYFTRNTLAQTQPPSHKPVENDIHLHGASSCTYHSAKVQENRRHIVKNGGIHHAYERTSSLASYSRKFSQPEHEHNSINENILSVSRSEIPNCRSPISNGTDNDDDESCRSTIKSNVVLSRHSSVSSLSEEEWALLKLCISSGMPRNKYRLKGVKNAEGNTHEDRDTIVEDNYSICS
ncbi:Adenomatous polyposis coli protein [Habropoda laboriosa]|uniref:Adenomatous polyposis coli protein n=1 Tax=Habropoda laboriosa TaxID=597456 RepID=A0A0L7RAH9_9HYME|nr:Adenomatous polyposis coli protein [Habropoda laboriosa]